MNLVRNLTRCFAMLAVLSMALWPLGCVEQSNPIDSNAGNSTSNTALGQDAGDEGNDPVETAGPEAGSALPGNAEGEAGSSLGGGVDLPGTESETVQE